MVPNGWKLGVLSELCEMQAGKFVKASDISSEQLNELFPCYGGNGLRGYTSTFTHDGTYSLIGRQGALCGNITFAQNKFHATEHAVVTTPKSEIDTRWLYYVLVDLNLNQYATGQAQPGLSVKNLINIPIRFPSAISEQRKIAQILSTWDKVIATTEKLIDASKQQKKALMQQLLTGKKRLVDPETGKAFEGDWEEVKLGDLGKTFTGLTGKTKEHFGRGSKYIPYINIFRNSSVDMNALELVDVRPNEKQNLVKYGDIFFTTSSETPEEVGMSSVILEEIDESVYLNSFCFGFRPHNFNRVKPEFIRYLLRSEKVRRSISLLAQGATRYNLSKTQLLKITLNIPSLGEQQKIASVLTAADKDIELLEAKLAHFKQEKKALMQQLLTGKKRVVI